ncbi:PREDICTED: anomalous homeobox protein [Gavialis gangeticus]|uniref:anomalous homeobox protein n=1 Tax=Gavialis gangeticus TaxID=94835 RepID=UPI00092EB059|nr:PREDICTED: anomalous homeobox protein [Gavialis gangeticus]
MLHRKGVQWNIRMKRFMRLLNKNKNKKPPEAQLLKLAGQLCQDFQSVSPSLQKLVRAVMGCKHWMHFLASIHIVRACVFVHIHWGQHETACRLLEHCRVEEKKELVALWHEIHYHRAMEKHRTDSLTPVQKFRCRKRNPPPVSLCPEGLKNRNYPEKVRRELHRFAAEVTTNPDKKQREGLARDTNLQPNQVYNWFANYRRRQKSRFSQVERLVSSTHEKVSAHQAKHQPESGSSMPQAADDFYADIGSGRVELTFVPCDPGWEQSAADADCSAVRTYSTLLNSSFLQGSPLQETRSSRTSVTALSTEEPAAFCTEVDLEPGTSLSSVILETREASSCNAPSPWLENLVPCCYGPLPFQAEELDGRQLMPSARGVSGASSWAPPWSPGTAGVRAPLSWVPPGGCIEASSGSVSQQAELEVGSFILREGQLGSLEAVLPCSSPQTVLGKPQCPPVSMPCVEESQALEHSQVLEDPLSNPVASDTFWAACLLFEFSVGSRM